MYINTPYRRMIDGGEKMKKLKEFQYCEKSFIKEKIDEASDKKRNLFT